MLNIFDASPYVNYNPFAYYTDNNINEIEMQNKNIGILKINEQSNNYNVNEIFETIQNYKNNNYIKTNDSSYLKWNRINNPNLFGAKNKNNDKQNISFHRMLFSMNKIIKITVAIK